MPRDKHRCHRTNADAVGHRCHGTHTDAMGQVQVPRDVCRFLGGAAGEVPPQDLWCSVLQDNKWRVVQRGMNPVGKGKAFQEWNSQWKVSEVGMYGFVLEAAWGVSASGGGGGAVTGVSQATSHVHRREEGPRRLLGAGVHGCPGRDQIPGRTRATRTCQPTS